jgi:hypothetical protein
MFRKDYEHKGLVAKKKNISGYNFFCVFFTACSLCLLWNFMVCVAVACYGAGIPCFGEFQTLFSAYTVRMYFHIYNLLDMSIQGTLVKQHGDRSESDWWSHSLTSPSYYVIRQ